MNLISKRSTDYRLGNTIFRVIYGDITQQAVETIVSSDDSFLSMGGGVSEAICRAGGETIREDAAKHVPLNVGDVAVTSAGKLPAKYVFHVVTIDYTKRVFPCEQTIQQATLECLQLADKLGVRAIAFPALGSGKGKVNLELCAEVMTRTIADYLVGETKIELVVLALFPRKDYVSESDLNIFYERAVAQASVYAQSKHMSSLMAELETLVSQMNAPVISAQFIELQNQLLSVQGTLETQEKKPKNLREFYNRSDMEELSRKVVSFSTQIQDKQDGGDKQLEVTVSQAKIEGLNTLLNIQRAQRNQLQDEGADLDKMADIDKKIIETQERIKRAKRPAYNARMDELKKAWDELVSDCETIDEKDFWKMIMETYKNYKDTLEAKSKKEIEQMIKIVPVLLKKVNEASRSGLDQDAVSLRGTVLDNYRIFMDTF